MRVAVAELPDGRRSVEEQVVEIRALEERVRALRGVLVGLGVREEEGGGGGGGGGEGGGDGGEVMQL